MEKKLDTSSLAVIAFNSFKDEAPLPMKLSVIDDDDLTDFILRDLTEKHDCTLSVAACALALDTAQFGVALANADAQVADVFHSIVTVIDDCQGMSSPDLIETVEQQLNRIAEISSKYSPVTKLIHKLIHITTNTIV